MGWNFYDGLIFKYFPNLVSHDDMSWHEENYCDYVAIFEKKRSGEKCRYCIGPHTVLDCGNDERDCTGLIPLFVDPLCVKSQHWWNCSGRVDLLFFPLWCLTVNKLTVLDITLFLTAPFFKNIFWDITSSCLLYLINFQMMFSVLWNFFVIKIFQNFQKEKLYFSLVWFNERTLVFFHK